MRRFGCWMCTLLACDSGVLVDVKSCAAPFVFSSETSCQASFRPLPSGPQVYSAFTMFSVKSTVIYPVQNTGFRSVFNLASKNPSIPLSSQTLENTVIYTVFFNFSMFQCRWPTQTHMQKILQKHCSLQCFYNVFR